jgi:hypothetical protein
MLGFELNFCAIWRLVASSASLSAARCRPRASAIRSRRLTEGAVVLRHLSLSQEQASQEQAREDRRREVHAVARVNLTAMHQTNAEIHMTIRSSHVTIADAWRTLKQAPVRSALLFEDAEGEFRGSAFST